MESESTESSEPDPVTLVQSLSGKKSDSQTNNEVTFEENPIETDEESIESSITYYSSTEVKGQTPYETLIQQHIVDAFEVLDESKKGLITPRDVSLVIRYLDCFPSEKEIKELLDEIEEFRTGLYKISDVVPLITSAIVADRFKRASEEDLIKAFEFLEAQSIELDAASMGDFLRDFGEPMAIDEAHDFIDHIRDPKTGLINYREYVKNLLSEELYKL